MSAISGFNGEYRWLSNFWSVEIIREDGIKYPSSEHAYVAAKVKDLETRRMIAALPTPGEAKKIGRKLPIREDWEDIKLLEMLSILRIKFKNPLLAAKLKSTGVEELIEVNNWCDTYWGVCNGEGLNILGELLMLVRSEL